MGEHSSKKWTCGCKYRALAPEHHDRLLALEQDPLDSLVELIEIATTWHELEYGLCQPVLSPGAWFDFALSHSWKDPSRISDLMIALSSISQPAPHTGDRNSSAPLETEQLASVTELAPSQRHAMN
jgi:hypothetical protein